jgi:hypothetical protein
LRARAGPKPSQSPVKPRSGPRARTRGDLCGELELGLQPRGQHARHLGRHHVAAKVDLWGGVDSRGFGRDGGAARWGRFWSRRHRMRLSTQRGRAALLKSEPPAEKCTHQHPIQPNTTAGLQPSNDPTALSNSSPPSDNTPPSNRGVCVVLLVVSQDGLADRGGRAFGVCVWCGAARGCLGSSV